MMIGPTHMLRLILVILVLLVTTPAWAVPLTGFIEGVADNGWQGAFSVQLADGTIVNGATQITGLLNSFQSLPLVTTGCIASPNCNTVTNLVTSTTFTMSVLVLNLSGSATLGNLGTVSWGTQPMWVLPGDPSPTLAVLANANGTLAGTTLTSSTFSFGFNGTLTSSFVSVVGGQALASLRLDFADGTAPPTSQTFRDGCCFLDNGVPIAFGTPLSVAAVPEPSSLLLLLCGLAVLGGSQSRKPAIN